MPPAHHSMTPATDQSASLCDRLLAWFRAEQRDLPWRRTRDPYAIWVSEIMLQQTRVATVMGAWEKFLEAFPDIATLAQASDEELLAAWKGLGYYRRVRSLRKATRQIMSEHCGRFPRGASDFAALPGVGAYTLGAVFSIAFDEPLPAIDGNVERVFSRLLQIEEDPKKKAGRQPIQDAVLDLLQEGRPSQINQALMELGATVCSPRSPSCDLCPWQASCSAHAAGREEDYPKLPPRQAAIEVETTVILARRRGKLLCQRLGNGLINEGQLCLPGLGIPKPLGEDLSSHLAETHGLNLGPTREIGVFRHNITKYRIRVHVLEMLEPPPLGNPPSGLSYQDPMQDSLPWSTVTRKAMKLWETNRIASAGRAEA
jgi:A/G-specific adenine glycosylase